MSQSQTTLFTRPHPGDTAAPRLAPSPLGETSPAHTPSQAGRTV
jgi:hypothetical protein